jgi:cyclophilin family peptidyl-prolyl cis-trans isomerase
MKHMNRGIVLLSALILVTSGCGAPDMAKDVPESASDNTQPDLVMQQIDPTTFEKLTETYSRATLHTTLGDIEVKFYGEESPITVSNFLNLVQRDFYNGTTFHRVIPDFMIQGGDQLSKDRNRRQVHGTGSPGYTFEDEFNEHKLVQGSLAMANSGPHTNGSQFFIVTAEGTPWLDGKHTNFGYVTQGMDVVMRIQGVPADGRDNPTTPVVIESITLK